MEGEVQGVKRKLALMAMCVALLTGCCGTTIRSGVIVDKQHRPAVTIYVPMRIGDSTIMMPHRYPETYSITVEGKSEEGKKATRVVDVTKEEWQGLSVGDDWKEIGR